jgi:hypothetical protein
MDTEDSIIFSSDMQGGAPPNKEYIYPEALVKVSKYVPQIKRSVLTLEDAVKLGYINKLGPLGALLLLSQGMLTVGNQPLTGGAELDGRDVGYYTYSEKIRNIFDTLISKLKPDTLEENATFNINKILNNMQVVENQIYELLYKIGSIIEESQSGVDNDISPISLETLENNDEFNELMAELKTKRKEIEEGQNAANKSLIDNYRELLSKLGIQIN